MIAADNHAALHREFAWSVPERFNIAQMCLHRWARETPAAVAIVQDAGDEPAMPVTYAALQRDARRLSNALGSLGVTRGDRVAIVMPQRPQTAVALMAVFQMGAIAVPLSTLFGAEALQSRLNDSGARLAIVDEASADAIGALRESCPALLKVMGAGAADGKGDVSWGASLAAARDVFEPTDTRADDPALLIYTSGTTGPAKGAVIPHRALIGNLSGFVASQDWFEGGGPFWSPADWAWTGGLWDALLPTLYFGRTIVASRARFDADLALKLMERHRVTHTFLFPTALKAMMRVAPEPRQTHPRLALKAIMSAGEAVGEGVFAYCRDKLGVVVNEMFGQTEINYVVGNCGRYRTVDGTHAPGWPPRAGSMGRPYPGHRVAVIDDDGNECPRGTPGDVALHRRDVHGERDPIFFLGYWKRDDATRAKFTGDPDDSWCRTGDTAVMDDDGYLWYQGRSDDVFKAAGYRIGPSEVENCLVKHPAVANAAVVPKPDAERGALVKAFVVVAPGHLASAELVHELQAHVRGKLAPYEYPKEIEFIDALPMTTTGKVQRRVLRLREEEKARGR